MLMGTTVVLPRAHFRSYLIGNTNSWSNPTIFYDINQKKNNFVISILSIMIKRKTSILTLIMINIKIIILTPDACGGSPSLTTGISLSVIHSCGRLGAEVTSNLLTARLINHHPQSTILIWGSLVR